MLNRFGRNREILSAAAGLIILVLALTALRGLLHEVDPARIGAAFASIRGISWAFALVSVAVSYTCLMLYDMCATRTLGLDVPVRTAASAGALSYAVSNMLGLSLLTGGTVRMAIYARAGIEKRDVIRVIALASLNFWFGIFVLFALSLLLLPRGIGLAGVTIPEGLRLGLPFGVAAGLVCLLIWLSRKHRQLVFGRLSLVLPGARLAIAQLLVAAVDLAACTAIIFVLVPDMGAAAYPAFLAAYTLALGTSVLTHSPGGLGVFEAVMLVLLPDVPRDALAAALIAYRLIYYLLPFVLALAVILFAQREIIGGKVRMSLPHSRSVAAHTIPTFLAASAFIVGAVLVWSSAVPDAPGVVSRLAAHLPHTIYSVSHLATSMVGAALMFIGWGLYRRLDAAWFATLALGVTGFLLAMFLGPDWVQASICAALALMLASLRSAFYRQTSLVSEPFSPQWLAAAASVLAITVFTGLWMFRNVAYANDLWWQFVPSGDAPRFLRAALGAGVVVVILAGRWLLAPARLVMPTELPEPVFAAALAQTSDSQAHLARTGDKAFLVAPEDDAFLMFRQSRHTLVVMGDPVGPHDRWAGLVWQLRAVADRQRARLAFYECSPAMLELAVDLGLGVIKLGEEASVPLADFTTKGAARARLRQALSRGRREELCFRIAEPSEIHSILPDLRRISDEWLASKRQREKQFSLGHFDPEYLCGAPLAVVERDGRVVAFANLWLLPSHKEMSFDLMRYGADAPPGTMDFMFVALMQWGQSQGYGRLSLGIAPMSGIDARRLAPLWARVANAIFRHGERYYGFGGLRRYKEKFAPVWTPRYLAAPRGIATVQALFDILMLVSAPRPPMSGNRVPLVRGSPAIRCERDPS
jgi:phosphatidylglycerol lysyltransferase